MCNFSNKKVVFWVLFQWIIPFQTSHYKEQSNTISSYLLRWLQGLNFFSGSTSTWYLGYIVSLFQDLLYGGWSKRQGLIIYYFHMWKVKCLVTFWRTLTLLGIWSLRWLDTFTIDIQPRETYQKEQCDHPWCPFHVWKD